MTDTLPTVWAHIEHHAYLNPEQMFLRAPELERELTFSGLSQAVTEISQKLDALAVPRGAKVAFLLNNGFWATQIFLAVMGGARVVVPLNAVAGEVQLLHVLQHSDAQVVFVNQEYRARLDRLLAQVPRPIQVIVVDEQTGPQWPTAAPAHPKMTVPDPEEPALLLYTSGSTGIPKGAIMSQRAVISGGRNVGMGHQLSSHDRALCVLPIYHINGAMVTVMAPLVSGSSVVMPTRFSVKSFWPLIAAHGCSWSSIVPTIIKYLLDRADQEPFDFGHDARLNAFRFARSASAPLPKIVLEQWENVFKIPMIETLGLTETAGTVAANPMPPRPRKPGSVGIAFGNRIKVQTCEGDDCGPDQAGEVLIQGDNVLDYYYKNDTATKAAFTDGWFRTGDIGKLDEQGYLFLTGRLKELIIRGGENIAPREIDDVLYKHEAVLEAAAVGVDDENYGQEVVACVALREGFACSENELKSFCAQQVGEYKAPKSIYFLDELPKGPSGKILRLKLPEIIQAQVGK